MNNNSPGKIRKTLDDLEDELKRIKGQVSDFCNGNSHVIFFKLSYGIAQLESMHHNSDERTKEIIDLHSQYINTSYQMFGNYYGSDKDE